MAERGDDGMNLMIVDDSAFMRMWIKETLQQASIPLFDECKSGEEAIAHYKKYKPDLVLLDIDLPDIDGITVLRRIKEIDHHANIVILTAMAQQKYQEMAKQYHATAFLTKPISAIHLIEMINRYKEKSQCV